MVDVVHDVSCFNYFFSLERNTESLKHVFCLNYRIKSCEGVGYLKKSNIYFQGPFNLAHEHFSTPRDWNVLASHELSHTVYDVSRSLHPVK